jgi:hypothetical protein
VKVRRGGETRLQERQARGDVVRQARAVIAHRVAEGREEEEHGIGRIRTLSSVDAKQFSAFRALRAPVAEAAAAPHFAPSGR